MFSVGFIIIEVAAYFNNFVVATYLNDRLKHKM